MGRPVNDDVSALLCQLLGQAEKRFSAEAYDATAIEALLHAGMIVGDGILDNVVCDACDTHHLSDVVRSPSGVDYGWHCPQSGFVVARESTVVALSIKPRRVADLISEALIASFGPKRWQCQPFGSGGAWLLGAWEIAGVWTTVILAPDLSSAFSSRAFWSDLSTQAYSKAQVVLSINSDPPVAGSPYRTVTPLKSTVLISAQGEVSVFSEVLVAQVERVATVSVPQSGRPNMRAVTHAVIDSIARDGAPTETINARSVAKAWPAKTGGQKAPADSTLRVHIRSWKKARSSV